jgi:hypothetical protein
MTGLPMLHRCAHLGCQAVTYTARCPAHAVPEDRELREALAEANVELVVAREAYQEAAERVAALEARVGIRWE